MKIREIKYMGDTYIYNADKPDFYCFDKDDMSHMIIYRGFDFYDTPYRIEWKIPGVSSDKEYAKRLCALLDPWDVVKIYTDEEAGNIMKQCY